MTINSNHSFLAFGREIENAKLWLQSRLFAACGYSSGMLVDRLMQRLIELSLTPYAVAVMALCSTAADSFPSTGSRIQCGRASLELGTGAVRVSLTQLLANQMDFLLHWGFCLGAILFPTRAAATRQPAVLVFGVGMESLFANGSDERFVAYCRRGPIEPLANAKRLLIQCSIREAVSTRTEFAYCARPLISLLRCSRLGLFARLALAQKHLVFLFQYLVAVIRLPALSLLGKDFAYSAISFGLDRIGLIEAIVFTTSNYNSQPLWVRGLPNTKLHLVWYAQNFKPVSYAADSVGSEIPCARWVRVDTHWVWTRTFGDYLRTLGHRGAIEVVGPIVWYLPESGTPSSSSIDIVVFDISPFSDDVALHAGGYISNYNNVDNLSAFIADVTALRPRLEAILQKTVLLRLKTKRGYNAIYDKTYFDHLDQLNSSGVISLVEHSSNIYSLISGSHLAVVYPFSSPAYIADALDVPAIYYDPTQSIVEQNFGDAPSLVRFANCPADLLNTAVVAIREVLAKRAMQYAAAGDHGK
ncbi:hypothetical protein [Sulfuritalea sp.]|uniref:hypothetical protein n=1 Tax=Sulfuritalea sp. TaxID=2480090 RepID=UPI001AD1F666|nr:hypothetical protein [Sulfuritalea sp.]MBN8473946.1 hypothetical protein [Sulfuritalea sp.]